MHPWLSGRKQLPAKQTVEIHTEVRIFPGAHIGIYIMILIKDFALKNFLINKTQIKVAYLNNGTCYDGPYIEENEFDKLLECYNKAN